MKMLLYSIKSYLPAAVFLTIGSKLTKMITGVVLGTRLSVLSSGTTSEDVVIKVPRNAVVGINKHYKQFLCKKEKQLSF